MILISRLRRPGGLTIWPMVLMLLFAASCSRPAGLQEDENQAGQVQHPVPFHDGDASPATELGDKDSLSAREKGPNPGTGLPFHDSRNLPAGTLLTVRLTEPISAENPGARGSFDAVVDAPIVIEGATLVPRGAAVVGRVESARASRVKRDRGYVRLALDSVRLSGLEVPIQTASLFVRGSALDADALPTQFSQPSSGQSSSAQASPAVVNLEKGRRLTFRLTEPVYPASQRALAGH